MGGEGFLEHFMQPDEMEKRLDDLQAQFKALSVKLVQQGKALQQGYPPDEELIEEVSACKNQFYAIKEMIEELGETYNLSAESRQSISTTAHLVQLWENIKPLLKPEYEECSATLALAAPTEDEASILPDLIASLIKENKLEPAFWLSAYYELLHEATPPVPPLWLKMIETSRHVTEHHPAAVKDLARFYRESAAVYEKEAAFQWLAFAAALLPSLRAPSSGAARVLDNLDALPPELTNLIAIVVKAQLENVKLESLASEADYWLEQNRHINPASPLAARLWASMLEENGLICKLLSPICANDGAEQYDDVSRLVKYLENETSQKKELSMQYRILMKKFRILLKNQGDTELDIFNISGSGMILGRLQEALKLARRWLNSHTGVHGVVKDQNKDSTEEKWDAAVAQARDIIDALANQQQESILLEMAILLAKQTLDRFANNTSEQALMLPDARLGNIADVNRALLAEPGGLPDKEAIEQIGKAIFNYFTTELEHSGTPAGQDGGNNKPPENLGLKNLLAKDDSGINEYLRDLVSQQEKDLLKDMLKEQRKKFLKEN